MLAKGSTYLALALKLATGLIGIQLHDLLGISIDLRLHGAVYVSVRNARF